MDGLIRYSRSELDEAPEVHKNSIGSRASISGALDGNSGYVAAHGKKTKTIGNTVRYTISMTNRRWLRPLAYVTGSMDQELLLRNEYLAAQNRVLRAKLPARLRLSNPERITLAEIGKRLVRKALCEVACVGKPDTVLAWHRKLVAQKFDGSNHRQYPGHPPVSSEVEALVVRMARENSGWEYDRIVGALANLGHHVSDQTAGSMLRHHGIAPAPKRSQITTWKDFLATHMNVLAECDFCNEANCAGATFSFGKGSRFSLRTLCRSIFVARPR